MFQHPLCRGPLVTFLVLSVVLPVAGVARTWVVAQDGIGDFEILRDACEAAASGDSILVRPGTYEDSKRTLLIEEKQLAILGGGTVPDDVRLHLSITFMHCTDILVQDLSFVDFHRALYLYYNSSATVRRCSVRNCISDSWEPPVVMTGTGSTLVEDCQFTGNSNVMSNDPESCEGGAIHAVYGTIRNCLFEDNISSGIGGAVYMWGGVVENCIFLRNTAPTGAAITNGGYATIRNCTMLANQVTALGGGAFQVLMDPTAESDHNIVAGTIGGAGVDCRDGGTFRCSDIWNNEGGDYSGWLCGISGSYGDFSKDPLFCDPETGDLGLREGSPCLPGSHGSGVPCGLVGARGLGCNLVPVLPMTWGRLKALYR
jgi:hypothetical protein